VNWSALPVVLVPIEFVTVMSTVPALCDGDVAVIEPPLMIVNDAASAAPNLTAVTPAKPEPLMVTDVPPAPVPVVGDTDVTDGVVCAAEEQKYVNVRAPFWLWAEPLNRWPSSPAGITTGWDPRFAKTVSSKTTAENRLAGGLALQVILSPAKS
jgi:hypothetical protein